MEFKVGDQIICKLNRCPCVGGGTTEEFGQIIDIKNQWLVVSTPSGVKYVYPESCRKQ